jgi:hypothetical protein
MPQAVSDGQLRIVQIAIDLRTSANAAVEQMRTRIRLQAQPKSMRSIIDATQREQRHGLA